MNIILNIPYNLNMLIGTEHLQTILSRDNRDHYRFVFYFDAKQNIWLSVQIQLYKESEYNNFPEYLYDFFSVNKPNIKHFNDSLSCAGGLYWVVTRGRKLSNIHPHTVSYRLS